MAPSRCRQVAWIGSQSHASEATKENQTVKVFSDVEVTELFGANLQNFQSPRQPVLIKLSPEIVGKREKDNFFKYY